MVISCIFSLSFFNKIVNDSQISELYIVSAADVFFDYSPILPETPCRGPESYSRNDPGVGLLYSDCTRRGVWVFILNESQNLEVRVFEVGNLGQK